MASEVVGVPVRDMECRFCLEVFKNATILSCGHTFCRRCLEEYDEQHDLDHIVCPVCRKSTDLGDNRVAGLTPNFLALGIQDVVAQAQSFCPLHRKVHNDIFCEDCKTFICLTCFFDNHRDHKIKKKEELEGDLKEKRDFLIEEGKMRKAQIEESVRKVELDRTDIQCHFSKLQKEIKDKFAKKVTILQQHEESLLEKLDSILKETENHLGGCIAKQRQAIDYLNNSITILMSYAGKILDADSIKTQYLHFSDLERSLEKSTDEESNAHLKDTAKSTRFRSSDEKLLALGHIEVGMKTDVGANKKPEHMDKRNVAVSPALVGGKSLSIVRMVDAPYVISGISARSHDTVGVGYGWFRHGSDCFSMSGGKTPHLPSKVGKVYDITFLSDGRSVVTHDEHKLCMYISDHGHHKIMEYTCKGGGHPNLCSDQDDNIYAVNGNPEIYIFHGGNPSPQRVIPTGDIRPKQICVTRTGALITSTCTTTPSTVKVFDREGHVGTAITANDNEQLYATVDSQDRVLVARVRAGSNVFRLTRYTVQGTTLIQQVSFKELQLPCAIEMFFSYCYMTSLGTNPIAFTNSTCRSLYFIELSE